MPIVLLVATCAAVMILIERVRPGRDWPQVRGWWLRAILLNAVQVGSVYLSGVAWDGWMLRQRPFNMDALGTAWGGVIGYLAMTFVFYWWHRARHASGFLWRVFHQVHHSPRRIEIITAFYKHPVEIIADALLCSAILYWGCGLGQKAAPLAVLISGFAELIYHWNVRTPYWLGFLFQRPESHCIHHQAGHHAQNYADLPMWDMLFGTFHNPKEWREECGMGEGEHRLGPMLLARDVSRPRSAA